MQKPELFQPFFEINKWHLGEKFGGAYLGGVIDLEFGKKATMDIMICGFIKPKKKQ